MPRTCVSVSDTAAHQWYLDAHAGELGPGLENRTFGPAGPDSRPGPSHPLGGSIWHSESLEKAQDQRTRFLGLFQLDPMPRPFHDFNKAQIIERLGERGAPGGIVEEHVVFRSGDEGRGLREPFRL